jgi:Mg-chelatase subunit ChlD
VEENGGVHVIQTFLSKEKSEEIQIQGRTARQGKEGSFQMILLDADLKRDFGLSPVDREKIPKGEWYNWLCNARDQQYRAYCDALASNLEEATKRDHRTHQYFDALLACDRPRASSHLKDIYFSMKKRPMPSKISIELAFAIDTSGSMGAYMEVVRQTISSLVDGDSSVGTKLRLKFPEVEFDLRFAALGFKDIDDGDLQYLDTHSTNSHFIADYRSIQKITQNPSGGYDLAEDVFGAIYRCATWNQQDDWSGDIKFVMLLTDAPAHGMVPACSIHVSNADNYPMLHPEGLTAKKVVDALITRSIDLFYCSFNPKATAHTEASLSKCYVEHKRNAEKKDVMVIPMTSGSYEPGKPALTGPQSQQHVVFVLDMSGSMSHNWSGVVAAYRKFIECRMQHQCQNDLVSVVQFDDEATVAFQNYPMASVPQDLNFRGGGTYYSPAAAKACEIALTTPDSHSAVVVFMSDGLADENDAHQAASAFTLLNQEYRRLKGSDLMIHVIAFGAGLDQRQLSQIMRASPKGKIHTSIGTSQLAEVFMDIANSSQDVAAILEKEIARRISDAVTDKLVLEYLS